MPPADGARIGQPLGMGGIQPDPLHGDPLAACLDGGANRASRIQLPRHGEWWKERDEGAAAITSELVDDDVVSVRQVARAPAAVMLTQNARAVPVQARGPLVTKKVGTQAERVVMQLHFFRGKR